MKILSKKKLGIDLKNLLSSSYDIRRIASWAYDLSLNYEEIPTELEEILENLSFMEVGPEFEYTEEKLRRLAERLIEEGEKEELLEPIPRITDRANEIDNNWLMCPLCNDAWESQSLYGMVRCPKCKKRLHNPRYQE